MGNFVCNLLVTSLALGIGACDNPFHKKSKKKTDNATEQIPNTAAELAEYQRLSIEATDLQNEFSRKLVELVRGC